MKKPTLALILILVFWLVAGCKSESHFNVSTTSTAEYDGYKLKSSPGCSGSNKVSATSSGIAWDCGDHKVEIIDSRLSVDGADLGQVERGQTVSISDGVVSIEK